MLKVLLQKQLAEIFRTYFYNAKTNKARSRGATIAYLVGFALLMVGLLGGIFAYLSVSLCGALSAVGMDWLFFALMGLLAVFLGAFGSVFNTYSSLYLAKDNDLLLSMPIPVRTIMASRLLGVYLMGLMYSGVVILPAVIVYWIMISASAAAIAGGVLLVALISLFVLTLSCALGWVVAKISLKLKNKSFITVFVSLVFLGVYYFFYFRAHGMQLLLDKSIFFMISHIFPKLIPEGFDFQFETDSIFNNKPFNLMRRHCSIKEFQKFLFIFRKESEPFEGTSNLLSNVNHIQIRKPCFCHFVFKNVKQENLIFFILNDMRILLCANFKNHTDIILF